MQLYGFSYFAGSTPEGNTTGWQSRAVALVRCLRPDALESFARLVAATLVQAAATGGAVLEPELLHLAQRDPNRFRRLHQRLQVLEVPKPRGLVDSNI